MSYLELSAQQYLQSLERNEMEVEDRFCAECGNKLDLHEWKHADICTDCEEYYNENGHFKK